MSRDPAGDGIWIIPDALDFSTQLSELKAEQRSQTSALLLSLVAVMDSFDRLLAEAPDTGDGQGVVGTCRLIARQLGAALERAGVRPIECLRAVVDPQVHEVVGVRPAAPREHDLVLDVLQRGYEWDGQLLRPAHVVVGRSEEEGLG